MTKSNTIFNPKLYSSYRGLRVGQPAFTRPTKDCLYIRILTLFVNNNQRFTRKETYDKLDMGCPANYHNCVWTGLKNAGFINKERVGKTFTYQITEKGTEYLVNFLKF